MKDMKKIFKLLTVSVLLCATVISTASCGIASSVVTGLLGGGKEEKFYELVSETQGLLDVLADDIYKNWYDCIYNDDFNNDIDEAIDEAFEDNEDIVEEILYNTNEINELYKDIKDGDLEDEAKEVMQAYNEYYSIVIEVSGSYNDYSAAKEPAKKALSTALKNYYSEL